MAILVGRIIVQKNAVTATQIDSAFSTTFHGTVTANHNDLGGLQGGTANEYYHLTSAQATVVGNILNGLSNISAPQFGTTVQTFTPTGTTQTIDWNSGQHVLLNLASATGNVTLTLNNPIAGARYLIRVTQGATARNLVFPAGTLQIGGGGVNYVGIASTVDVISVSWNGTTYDISVSRNLA